MGLDFRKGHQRWTISDLSRSSGITRSLIYYYFGKSREKILLEAVKALGEEFFGLTNERLMLWKQGKISESVLLSRKFIQSNPDLAAFYLLHRAKDSTIGETLRELEKKHHQKLMSFFKGSSEASNRARAGLLFGLVFAAGIPDNAVLNAVRVAQKLKL
jgi:AcrR family transcriptional regulator